MTPDDVALDLAAMRGYLGTLANEMGRAMLRVCDALEAEIAKRQRAFAEMLEERKRAERAEAELAAEKSWHLQYVDEANAEYNALADALDRVREQLCGPCICCRATRAAIEGDNQ